MIKRQEDHAYRQAGFSLLELLVVISIIGILIAIGAVAFTTAQKRGRDARRRGDIKAWQDALEQTYAEYTDYTGAGTDCQSAVDDHMNGVTPVDPKGASYDTTCTADVYCICAELEAESGGNSDTSACAFDDSGDETYYCLNSLQ